jgi:hypothetical protein
MGKNKIAIRWLDKPAKDDFAAAENYLGLLFDPATATKYITKLRRARGSEFKAKDLLRASDLSPLGISNARIERDRKKIAKGTLLSPILLVRDSKNVKLIIADGYHRLCAAYSVDEDATVPCWIE